VGMDEAQAVAAGAWARTRGVAPAGLVAVAVAVEGFAYGVETAERVSRRPRSVAEECAAGAVAVAIVVASADASAPTFLPPASNQDSCYEGRECLYLKMHACCERVAICSDVVPASL
jgi:hypothetical protein